MTIRYGGFGPDDEIELVPGVVLRRSGQRWPGERTEGVRARPPRRPGKDDELRRAERLGPAVLPAVFQP